MSKQLTSVIFSPHCDDAFLAMGGWILAHIEDVHVVDIFATCAWTTDEANFSSEELTVINQTEERKLAKEVGVALSLYEYPEALLRGYKEWNAPQLLADDASLAVEINKTMKEHIKGVKQVYFPLAPGHHVDHVIVHEQMTKLFDEMAGVDIEVYVYEDLPYSWYGGVDERIASLQETFQVVPEVFDITDRYEQKEELLGIYKSQLGVDDLRKVREYSASIMPGKYSERIWKISK